MHYDLLVPVSLPLEKEKREVESIARRFSHLEGLRISFFFWDLCAEGTTPPSLKKLLTAERMQVIQALEQEAVQLGINYRFLGITPDQPLTLPSLTNFADLLIIPSGEREEKTRLILEDVQCPVFLGQGQEFDSVVVIFDYDVSAISALKSFLALFGDEGRSKPLTILALNPEDEEQLMTEKYLVNYLKEYFRDVGVLSLASSNLPDKLWTLPYQGEHPLLITGRQGRAYLESPGLTEKGISIHFSNK